MENEVVRLETDSTELENADYVVFEGFCDLWDYANEVDLTLSRHVRSVGEMMEAKGRRLASHGSEATNRKPVFRASKSFREWARNQNESDWPEDYHDTVYTNRLDDTLPDVGSKTELLAYIQSLVGQWGGSYDVCSKLWDTYEREFVAAEVEAFFDRLRGDAGASRARH